MEIRPIRTKADYRAALIEGLMSAGPRTPELPIAVRGVAPAAGRRARFPLTPPTTPWRTI